MGNKRDELQAFLSRLSAQGVALAFSGGVDSTLLLEILSRLRQERAFPLVAFTIHTPFHEESGKYLAATWAQGRGIPHRLLYANPLDAVDMLNNPPNRCYLCKHRLFSELRTEATRNGLGALMDGTNADDLTAYRPGLKALKELGGVSPLAELGFSKSDVRDLAAELGLACSRKPSLPCLATRFEYGTTLTPERLQKVLLGERFVRSLFSSPLDVRLRMHGSVARIEVSIEALSELLSKRELLVLELKSLGFTYLTLDLEGFRSGSMDALLSENSPI